MSKKEHLSKFSPWCSIALLALTASALVDDVRCDRAKTLKTLSTVSPVDSYNNVLEAPTSLSSTVASVLSARSDTKIRSPAAHQGFVHHLIDQESPNDTWSVGTLRRIGLTVHSHPVANTSLLMHRFLTIGPTVDWREAEQVNKRFERFLAKLGVAPGIPTDGVFMPIWDVKNGRRRPAAGSTKHPVGFVFSAFLDRRYQVPFVRVLGVANVSQQGEKPTTCVTMFGAHEDKPQV